MHASTYRLLALVGLALLAGVAVYAFDRPPGSAWFLPAAWSLGGSAHPLGVVTGQLPEFLHVFAFSLLTAMLLPATRRAAWASCVAWWLIDSLFELGQHPKLSPILAAATSGLRDIPLLGNTSAYFARGVFDPLDLLAIALGALAAGVCIHFIHAVQRQKKDMESCAHAHSN